MAAETAIEALVEEVADAVADAVAEEEAEVVGAEEVDAEEGEDRQNLHIDSYRRNNFALKVLSECSV